MADYGNGYGTEQFRNLQESGRCNIYVSGTKIILIHLKFFCSRQTVHRGQEPEKC